MIAKNIVRTLGRASAMVAMVSILAGSATVTGLAATITTDGQGNKGNKPAKGAKVKNGKGPDHDTTVVINIDVDGHRRIVRDYYTHGNLPPGLAKRRTLPPGLRMQLHEKGALPPGLRDYYTPVPAAWNSRFQVVPVYYTRYFVGRDLIIIDTRNDTLVSLIRDILD